MYDQFVEYTEKVARLCGRTDKYGVLHGRGLNDCRHERKEEE